MRFHDNSPLWPSALMNSARFTFVPCIAGARQGLCCVLPLALLLVTGLLTQVQAEPLEYNKDIRPILAEHCFACHGADSASRKADLRLDMRESALEMGAIHPGKPAESALIERIFSEDADLVMPPPETKKQLTEEERQRLREWITQGAEYQQHWAFIAPEKPELPTVSNKDWKQNPIDRFVLARLEQAGLTPAPPAEPHTLFRRLHLDITGLPPRPEDLKRFLQEYEKHPESALETWVDRLLESPAWGEHRGRYWLDAARYGDTHGLHFDNYREMWPYRDWVIRAFNKNQPFDEFIVEQIAGDLLPEPSQEQLIATGFQRCNITTNEGGTIDEENLALYAADRVQTLGWVFLGLTTNCAQCHDHKFDPITLQDYYSLAAYFRNTTQPAKDGNVRDGRGPILVLPSEADQPRWEALPQLIAETTKDRNESRRLARQAFDKTWHPELNDEKLTALLPQSDLLLHLPLNEPEGNSVSNALQEEVSYQAEGDVAREPTGPFGPAPIAAAGSNFDLRDAGDFEKDQAFSVSVWIRPAKGDASAAIIARMDEANSHRGWDLWQQGASVGMHLIDTWPDKALKAVTRNAVLKPGKWQHVCATYDGSGKIEGIKIFVDGESQPLRVEKETLSDDSSFRTETPLRIGQRSQGAVFEKGAVQDLKLYSRALNGKEAAVLAGFVETRKLLEVPLEERKPEQVQSLFDFYLRHIDQSFHKLQQQVQSLEAEQNTIKERSTITHIQTERADKPAMAHILLRGEYDQPGEEVAAAPPAALHPLPKGAPANRLGLAQWLIDPANPLTARVTVNRFWQEVFGQGLVPTAEDFGVMGLLPSHPELLDWLALDFQESGWDVKRFYKQMFLSATYQQAAWTTPEKWERDRENALLSRGPRFRMDAEMLRDQALATSGLLSENMYGPSVKPYQPEGIWSIVGLPNGNTRVYKQDTGPDLYRRSVYTFWKRMAPPPNMEAFNAPSREFCVVQRERTNTPLQALVALNDPQFVEAARHLAQQELQTHISSEQTEGAETDSSAEKPQAARRLLNRCAQRVLSRPLDDSEAAVLLEDLQAYLDYYRQHEKDAQAFLSVGDSPRDESLPTDEFAAWTLICNQLLNLDEALNK